jgi:hypothetical protein
LSLKAQPAISFWAFGNLIDPCYAGTLARQGNSFAKGQGKTYDFRRIMGYIA